MVSRRSTERDERFDPVNYESSMIAMIYVDQSLKASVIDGEYLVEVKIRADIVGV